MKKAASLFIGLAASYGFSIPTSGAWAIHTCNDRNECHELSRGASLAHATKLAAQIQRERIDRATIYECKTCRGISGKLMSAPCEDFLRRTGHLNGLKAGDYVVVADGTEYVVLQVQKDGSLRVVESGKGFAPPKHRDNPSHSSRGGNGSSSEGSSSGGQQSYSTAAPAIAYRHYDRSANAPRRGVTSSGNGTAVGESAYENYK